VYDFGEGAWGCFNSLAWPKICVEVRFFMRPTLLSGLILLAFFALSSAGAALADGIKISGPLLEVNPHTHDFGQLTQDTERRINVVLRNAGTEALLIENVDSDCGCTTAMLPDTLLAPGDST